jgi:WD40-like Beta Propeller Repeat
MLGKLMVKRAGVVALVGVAVLAAGWASIGSAAAASHHRAATRVLRGAESPSWSPNGKQIVFTSVQYAPGRFGPVPVRYRIVRTSSKPGGAIHTVYAGRRKGNLPYESMRWTASGRIVFSLNALLMSVSADGGKPKGLFLPSCRPSTPSSNPDCYPADFILSPNREVAAVSTSAFDPNVPDGIALAKVNSAKPAVLPTPLTAEEQGYSILDTVLAFSPDSTQLVFSRSAWNGPGDTGPPILMAIPLSGGGPVPLAQSGIPGAGLVPNDAQQVQWSPDTAWVALVENQSLEVAPTVGGSAPHVLATCPGPDRPVNVSWSPTSKVIAFDCYSPVNGSAQLRTVKADGTQLTNLLKGRPLAYVDLTETQGGAQWSPDGTRLLFLAHRIGYRTNNVWTIRPNGHDLTRLG